MLMAVHCAVLVLAAVLLVLAAINDARHYRIPNRICLALLTLFPVFVATAPQAVAWEQNIMVFGLMLVSGLALFWAHVIGAGDIKLLATVGLWGGMHWVGVFLLVTALAGGVVTLAVAALTFARQPSQTERLSLAKVPVPYGIAIAVGGLTVFYRLSAPVHFSG